MAPVACFGASPAGATNPAAAPHPARSSSVFQFAIHGRRVELRGLPVGPLRRPSCEESHRPEWPLSPHSGSLRHPRWAPSPRCSSARILRHIGELQNRNAAQCAPLLRHGFSVPLRECAQSPWVFLMVKSGDFPVEFEAGSGLENRRLDVTLACLTFLQTS
jgi:hypothetical protein